jgi:alpha-galactosidase
MATLWIGAASNLLTGSDMTKLDVFGIKLLGDLNALSIAQITAKFPMQARNPGTGRNESQRLQS